MEQVRERITLLDELRGAAIVLMFICHITFDIFLLSGNPGYYTTWIARNLAPITGGLFTFISGVCSCYSRGTIRRGAIVFAAAMLITIATTQMGQNLNIYFGVLHMLGSCMILAGLAAPLLNRVNPITGAAFSLLLYCAAVNLPVGYLGFGALRIDLPAVLYQIGILFPLGFRTMGFFSADYYPLLPWFFLFLAGRFVGAITSKAALPESVYENRAVILSWMGGRSLAIYLIHQPLFVAILWLGAKVLGL